MRRGCYNEHNGSDDRSSPINFVRKWVLRMKRKYVTPSFRLTVYLADENLTVSNGRVDNNPNLDNNKNWVESDHPF